MKAVSVLLITDRAGCVNPIIAVDFGDSIRWDRLSIYLGGHVRAQLFIRAMNTHNCHLYVALLH